jgi:hypothetical protein
VRIWGIGLTAFAVVLASACGTTVPPTVGGAPVAQDPGLGITPPSPGAVGPVLPGSEVPGAQGDSYDPATAPGASPTAPPSTPALAPNTSPLRIGVTYINNDATSAALGVEDPSTISKKSIVRALVRGMNAAGGAAGRRLESVEYEWNSQSNSWSSDATAACELFTRDAKVGVVLDNAFGTIGGFRSCLQRAGVFVIQSGPEGDGVASRAATLHANSTSTTVERGYGAVLRGLAATGYLSRRNKVGVLVEGCVENTRAWNQVLKPQIARMGLAAPEEATVDCTNAFANAGAAASSVNGAILRFRQRGVDRVMFVSDNEAVLLLLWATASDSQGYYPGYLLSSSAQAQSMRTQVPADQWPQLRGVGNQPFGDTDGPMLTAVDRRCVELVKRAGVRPANQLDHSVVLFECGPFLLLDATLRASGGAGSGTALRAAVASLARSFAGPGLVGGVTRFGPHRLDGPDQFRAFGYDSRCTCMRPSGPTFS